MAEAWLVAGLGNPGERYARTRHNIGAMVVQRLAERLGAKPKKVRFVSVLAAEAKYEGIPLLLCLPLAHMNVSGPPIASFARKRRVPIDRVVVCHDDIDLGFGALKIKRGGGTAGHRGVDSLVAAFREGEFYRVRLGVGRPPGRRDPVDYVLEPFSKREREDVALLIEEGAEAVLSLVSDGLTVTQSRYNRGGVRET